MSYFTFTMLIFKYDIFSWIMKTILNIGPDFLVCSWTAQPAWLGFGLAFSFPMLIPIPGLIACRLIHYTAVELINCIPTHAEGSEGIRLDIL